MQKNNPKVKTSVSAHKWEKNKHASSTHKVENKVCQLTSEKKVQNLNKYAKTTHKVKTKVCQIQTEKKASFFFFLPTGQTDVDIIKNFHHCCFPLVKAESLTLTKLIHLWEPRRDKQIQHCTSICMTFVLNQVTDS